mgnify:CR=1 FL=1|jgi:uncharacterized Zn-binding protein involved in type VI secretion
MPNKVTRVTDLYSCGDRAAAGSPTVFVGGLPVHRQGDATTGHGCFPPTVCAGGNTAGVMANGIAIAVTEVSNNVPHCCPPPNCHSGVLVTGAGDVTIG